MDQLTEILTDTIAKQAKTIETQAILIDEAMQIFKEILTFLKKENDV